MRSITPKRKARETAKTAKNLNTDITKSSLLLHIFWTVPCDDYDS